MNQSARQYAKMYFEYLNNFLTIRRFAEFNNITPQEAYKAILKGKAISQDRFGHH